MLLYVECLCIGETAAAGAVLTGIPLRGLLGVLWTEIFCPVPPGRPKSKDLISDFTVVEDSEGAEDVLLT
jgi:hypothetical protein